MIATAVEEQNVTTTDKARLLLDQLRKECRIDEWMHGQDAIQNLDETIGSLPIILSDVDNPAAKEVLSQTIVAYNNYTSGRLNSVEECVLFSINTKEEVIEVLEKLVQLYNGGV